MTLDTRISLHKLEVLCAVVESGGVSRAADQLFIRQPVVTAHIRSLEERLGAKLFERSGRGVEPTEIGMTVYNWAKEVLSRSREMAREVEGLLAGSGGSAVIAAGMTAGTYVLPPVLIGFHRENPAARVTLMQQAPEHALEATSVGDADFAVVLGDENRLELPNLRHERLRDERLVLVAAPGADCPDVLTVGELGGMRFVCSPERGSLRRAMIEQTLQVAGAGEREVVLALDHPTAIKRCVAEGVGVALLFLSSVEDELASGTLRQVVLTDAELTIPLFLVFRADKRFAPVQQRLVDHIRGALAHDGT